MTFSVVTEKPWKCYWLLDFPGGFRVTGRICSQCSLLDPLNGELTVEASPVPILSIDIHLFRVESILIGEKIATETSLIQTTQAYNLLLFSSNLVSFLSIIFTCGKFYFWLDSRWRCIPGLDFTNLCHASTSFDLSHYFCWVSRYLLCFPFVYCNLLTLSEA